MKRSFFGALLVGGFLSPAVLHAQSSLEVPTSGVFVSGLGFVAGWKCTAGTLTFSVDNGPPAQLVYGVSRNDTQGVCGHSNTGFIAEENWNLVGDGQHTLRVFDNGSEFAEATFTVTTLGTEYLKGASGATQTAIAGQFVTLQWQENAQNYVIVGAAPGGTTLDGLKGTWVFTYDILILFADQFSLTTLVVNNGTPGLAGTDDTGHVVLVERTADVSSNPPPYTFVALTIHSTLCEFFLFDQPEPTRVKGLYYQTDTTSTGGCNTSSLGSPYPMDGFRLEDVVSQAPLSQALVEQREQLKVQMGAQTAQPTVPPDASVLETLQTLNNHRQSLCAEVGC